ncbi:MAG: hypothetical protein U5O39_17635 [Gammaproteobacteria bacterium]|nr:hypothetical protein [Gammaproteobacteria bacterium]
MMGNLFYRGLVLRQPVLVGDTLTTTTRVVALRQNSKKPGRAASGMVALEIHVRNQREETVMLFWRCPMIPCRDPEADTGQADSFDFMPEEVTTEDLKMAAPAWDLSMLRGHRPPVGEAVLIGARDTVTMAPELVRLTLNMAMTHTDAARSVYGKRLVDGGHAISMAAAQMTRALPAIATVLGWFRCDHVGPVFEGDILLTIDASDSGAGGASRRYRHRSYRDVRRARGRGARARGGYPRTGLAPRRAARQRNQRK